MVRQDSSSPQISSQSFFQSLISSGLSTKRKKIRVLLLVGAICSFVFLISYTIYNIKYIESIFYPQDPSLAVLNAEDMVNWKTYTNEPYRFTFRYPQSVEATTNCGWGNDVTGDNNLEIIDIMPPLKAPEYHCDDSHYYLSFSVSQEDTSMDAEINEIKKLGFITDSEVIVREVTLGGKKVKNIVVSPSTSNGIEGIPGSVAYFLFYDPIQHNVYKIFTKLYRPDYASVVNTIVSTFTILPSKPALVIKTPFYKYFPKNVFSTKELTKRNYNAGNAVIDAIPDGDLVDFQCSYAMSMSDYDLSYYYFSPEEGKRVSIPIASQIAHFINNNPRASYKNMIYCVTMSKAEYVFATSDDGLEAYQIYQEKPKNIVKGDTHVQWGYLSCDSILAITKEGDIYVQCGGSPGGDRGYHWLDKIDSSNGYIQGIDECKTNDSSCKSINDD